MADATNRSRAFLIAILALCLLPMLAAWWLKSSVEESGPWETTNHGTLMTPGTNLESIGLVTLESNEATWRLIIVPGEKGCGGECQQALPTLRALHLRLGKDSGRVQRVFVGSDAPEGAEADHLSFESILAPVMLNAGVYIADPLGNLVLRYDWNQVGTPLYEDFKHLLELSRIG